ncbi:MAG: BMP family ABC transporter substrate-binding protein [Chloroflexi bacterium]|nr:MAG: BMP family ABC transporter substrate-binding protein [Chloroflexota bacterium]TME20026.1 MAG: BMP family ABC transporter substrate-binding protein [Chloroflexota bacterium]
MKRWNRVSLAIAGLALLLTACGGSAAVTSGPPRLIVGALHVGSVKDAGYNEAQHAGLAKLMANVSGIKLLEAENIPEGPDAERVMEDMIRQGAKLIFPQSFGYQDFALNVAKKYPDVKFEHPAGYKSADNFGTYWASSHDLSYLLGVAAGKETKTNKLGFVAGFPIPQILATVNAFHEGARSVNPNVTTHAVFNGSWVDPGKEATATNALADEGVDVVTMVVDSPITVVQTAEKRGIHSIGYHYSGVSQFAPKGWISGVTFEWGDMFTQFANDTIAGTWKSQSLLPGLGSGTVKLADWGKSVPQDVKDQVATEQNAFLAGTRHVFQGPVYDQQGKLRIKSDEITTPAAEGNFINTDDWLAQGVIGQTK